MSLPHILLGLLRQPATGYDLRRLFETGASHYWAAELSQIYPALKKLETGGHVRSEQAPPDKGPRRRLYHRTKSGRDELVRWVESGPTVGAQRLAYLAQIEFAHEAGNLQLTEDLVAGLRESFQPLRELLHGAEEELKEGTTDADFHELLSVRLGVLVLDARLAWCDEAERRIKERSI